MKILQLHNRYSSLGGEDSVVEEEKLLLEEHGHEVEQCFVSNAGLRQQTGLQAVGTGLRSLWSRPAYEMILAELRRRKPDVLHVHNTFGALSPSVYWAAKAAGTTVVLTLHNYRLTCATSVLLRDGRPCEKCVGHFPLAAIRHRCRYVNSVRVGTTIAASQVLHGWLGTYRHKVDGFIALTDFARDIFIRAGLPAAKIHVKPNFVTIDASEGEPVAPAARQVTFVGLVSELKGVDLLAEASSRLAMDHRVVIVGDGPERPAMQARFAANSQIAWLGKVDRAEARRQMAASRWMALPSRWYEGFPVVILEAMAAGRPVIVPDHGAFPTMVAPNENALLFKPNDPDSLRQVLERAFSMGNDEWQRFSRSALAMCRERYSVESNYKQLIQVYQDAARVAHASAA